jgi:hypothetical protein
MIDDPEIRGLAGRLGVPENQIRLDHLLSHLIAALPREDRVVFIGGSAAQDPPAGREAFRGP